MKRIIRNLRAMSVHESEYGSHLDTESYYDSELQESLESIEQIELVHQNLMALANGGYAVATSSEKSELESVVEEEEEEEEGYASRWIRLVL